MEKDRPNGRTRRLTRRRIGQKENRPTTVTRCSEDEDGDGGRQSNGRSSLTRPTTARLLKSIDHRQLLRAHHHHRWRRHGHRWRRHGHRWRRHGRRPLDGIAQSDSDDRLCASIRRRATATTTYGMLNEDGREELFASSHSLTDASGNCTTRPLPQQQCRTQRTHAVCQHCHYSTTSRGRRPETRRS